MSPHYYMFSFTCEVSSAFCLTKAPPVGTYRHCGQFEHDESTCFHFLTRALGLNVIVVSSSLSPCCFLLDSV